MRLLSLTFLSALLSWNVFATETAVQIALNWKPEPQFGGFYAATESKADAKQGLKFTLLEGGSGTPTVQMLANHRVDFAVVSAEEILISNERNPKNPVVALFAAYQTNPQMIMCHEEKGFTSLKDVFAAPVTLSWQSGLSYAQFLRKKYPSPKAKLVPYAGGVSAFLANKDFCQQGFITSEPLSAEKAGAKVKAFLVADEGFNPYTTVLATRADVLKSNPDVARKVVAAVRDGWTAYENDPGPANGAMHKLNKSMDPETFLKSAQAQKTLIETAETKKSGLGTMTDARWTALVKTLAELKQIQPTASLPYKNM
jgi:NitT/TauT family transport system substrate-binding protein